MFTLSGPLRIRTFALSISEADMTIAIDIPDDAAADVRSAFTTAINGPEGMTDKEADAFITARVADYIRGVCSSVVGELSAKAAGRSARESFDAKMADVGKTEAALVI
jgi:hypothetical protein